jgi:hypothetical protein
MSMRITGVINMGRDIREQDSVVSQNSHFKIVGTNQREHAAFAESYEDVSSGVALSRPAELDEVRMQQCLHAALIAASFILMEFCLQRSNLVEQVDATRSPLFMANSA